MVKFYVSMINAGKMNIDSIPPKWRNQVKNAIEQGKVI